ncbi:polysialyltransferase family glycosyltransferase [Aeromonas hydrophila]|uniref:polysialyltransferase family glycosyltransferase n=1 Tax=Aeromonas hydrophila TaxID=644 RepID=UPI0038D0D6C6
MNYFLINNNFHLQDVIERIQHFSLNDVCLICVPHRLDMSAVDSSRIKYEIFESPLTHRGGCFNIFKILSVKNKVSNGLTPTHSDELYIYTEYELLNHFIVKHFKCAGAKVSLIEENGLATYALNKVATRSNLHSFVLKRPKYFLPALIFSDVSVQCYVSGRELFPILQDNWFDTVIYYSPISCNRGFIPTIESWKNNNVICDAATLAEKVLFLSQDLYNFYMSLDEYFDYLDKVHDDVLSKYKFIYFKFHPREMGGEAEKKVRSRYPHFLYIDNDTPIEAFINEISPDLTVSFFSSSLINLSRSGWRVCFTLSKWSGIRNNELLCAINDSLCELGLTEPLSHTKR